MKRSPMPRGTKPLERKAPMPRGKGPQPEHSSASAENVQLRGVNLRESFVAVTVDGRPRKVRSVESRFWKHVRRETGEQACWVWTGSRSPKGYGRMAVRHGVMALAHRVSYVLHHGQIPEGLSVLHKCDNPPCVRPDHLFAGTAADNTADMMAKGRNDAPRSLRNGRAKLSDAEVAEIRRRRREGESAQSIAANLGLSRGYVGAIVSGRRRNSPPKTAPKPVIDLVKERAKGDVAGLCEIGLICTGRAEATQTAHRRGKGSGGVGPKNATANTPSNLLRGCADCHDRIDNAEVADAERLGLKIRHTLALPSEVPVHLHNLNGWVLLDDEGGYRPAPATSYGRPEGVLPVISIDPYEHEFGDEGVVFDGVDRWGHIDCGGWCYEVDGACVCDCGAVLFVVEVTP